MGKPIKAIWGTGSVSVYPNKDHEAVRVTVNGTSAWFRRSGAVELRDALTRIIARMPRRKGAKR